MKPSLSILSLACSGILLCQPALPISAQSRPAQNLEQNETCTIDWINAFEPGTDHSALLKKGDLCTVRVDLCIPGRPVDEDSDINSLFKAHAENQESFQCEQTASLELDLSNLQIPHLLITFDNCMYTGLGTVFRFTLDDLPGNQSFQFEPSLVNCLPEQVSGKAQTNQDTFYFSPVSTDSSLQASLPGMQSANLPSGIQKEEDPGNEQPSRIAAATPYIIVEKYTYGGDSVTAGQLFDLTLYFKNTSKTLPVENIMLSLETEEGLSITSSSNSFYVEELKAGQTLSQSIQMKALGSDRSSSPAITISFRYEYVDDGSRLSQSSTERISIPVIEPDRFEVSQPSAPESVSNGEETILSFPYVNKGKGTLSNVAVSVDGDIPTLSNVQNLGNFEAGKSGTIDIILVPDETRTYSFDVKIAYENASGDPVELRYPYTIEVTDPIGWDEPLVMPEEPVEPVQDNTGLWAILIGTVVLILAALGFWKWKKNKKNHQDAEDEEDWFDESIFDDHHGDSV